MKMSGFARIISSISERNEVFLLSMIALATLTPFGSTVSRIALNTVSVNGVCGMIR